MNPADYTLLCGNQPKPEESVIIQFYNTPYLINEYYRYDPTVYWTSNTLLYTSQHTKLHEMSDLQPYKDPLASEYNALYHGLSAATKLNANYIILHTNADILLGSLMEEYVDSEDEDSELASFSSEVDDLHSMVMDLLGEFEGVMYRSIPLDTLKRFEEYVNVQTQYNHMNINMMRGLAVSASCDMED